MPGWACALEALARGEECRDAICMASLTSRLLTIPGVCTVPTSMLACLSLAASTRKILALENAQPTGGLPQGGMQKPLSIKEIMCVVNSSCKVLHYLGSRPPKEDRDSCGNVGYLREVNNMIVNSGSSSGRQHRWVYVGAGTSAAPASSAQLSTPSVHQLQVITLITMLQAAKQWLLWEKAGNVSEHHDWLEAALLVVSLLGRPALKAMAESEMSNVGKAVPAQSESGARLAWERYAVTHFHGRLLPGCCNLACTNLAGVSEATLKTKLCSGCGRARYCSVECQKTAWRKGGHATVCACKV